MEFDMAPGVESPGPIRASPVRERMDGRRRTHHRWRGSMNPLDSITGTIVSGVILALILAALF